MTHLLISLEKLDEVVKRLKRDDNFAMAALLPRENQTAIDFLELIRKNELHIDLSENSTKQRAASYSAKFYKEEEEEDNFPSIRLAAESYAESINDILEIEKDYYSSLSVLNSGG